ncbi:MAG: VacJ family lipoprotein [Proteobacteria bacterium]|nr:VacJ family lipoprotein [Pseudomonadota bacterium]
MRSGLAALGFAAACAIAPNAHAQDAPAIHDPWEGFNRKMFALNDALDHAIFEPVARGYRAIMPRPVRNGVANFLNNLRSPVVFVNNVLQGNGRQAGTTVARFGINSTLGLLGVLDPATSMGLPRRDADFGQTLGKWGSHPGPYLFLPIIGPTNVRDGVGSLVDLAIDPINWADYEHHNAVIITRGVVYSVATRESLLDATDQLRRTSLDPYVSVRSGYSLLRESAIHGGPTEMPALQDIPEVEPDAATAPETPPVQPPPSDGVTPGSQLPDNHGAPDDHLSLNNIPTSSPVVSLAATQSMPISQPTAKVGNTP